MFLFEKLNVYQKALDFADQINNISQAFPKGSWYFVDQLSRTYRVQENEVTSP